MDLRTYTLPILVLFVLAAVFGVYLMFGPMHGSFGCPLMNAEAAICATSIVAHLSHWQSAFASILIEILLLAGVALIVASRREALPILFDNRPRFARAHHVPQRPTLIQELYADGVLNRKEPSRCVV